MDCTPKTCSVTKTRQVPQTRTETKTRQVPRFRDEPRYAAWYGWKTWDWVFSRKLEKTGTTLETIWPSEIEQKADAALAKGEKERATRHASYFATLESQGHNYEISVPSLEEFSAFAPGSRHRLRVWNEERAELAPN
jgi:hypothetical protein